MKPAWKQPLMGEWNLNDFIAKKDHPDAIGINLGFCPDCGWEQKSCTCGRTDA